MEAADSEAEARSESLASALNEIRNTSAAVVVVGENGATLRFVGERVCVSVCVHWLLD